MRYKLYYWHDFWALLESSFVWKKVSMSITFSNPGGEMEGDCVSLLLVDIPPGGVCKKLGSEF